MANYLPYFSSCACRENYRKAQFLESHVRTKMAALMLVSHTVSLDPVLGPEDQDVQDQIIGPRAILH